MLLVPRLQAGILTGTHTRSFVLRLVFETAKMQCSVEYYTVKLLIVSCMEEPGILFYALRTDVDLSGYLFRVLRQVKGNDIRQGIVVQELLVHFQQGIVRAEDISKLGTLCSGVVLFEYSIQKRRQLSF